MPAAPLPAVLLAAAFVLWAQTPSPDAPQKLAHAATLAREHRYVEADRLLKGIPAPEDRQQAIAFYRLHAAIDAALKRPEDASRNMHAALRLSPEDSVLRRAAALTDVQLAEKQEAAGDSIAAVKSFQSAVRLAPDSEQLRLDLALELVAHQTYPPALELLNQSANVFPQSSRIRTALGLTLFLSGREQEAAAEVLKALALDPQFVPAVRYLGEIGLSGAGPPGQALIEAECRFADAHSDDAESNAACGALEARVAAADAAADWAPILRRLASAASTAPGNALAHCEYGKALQQVHDLPHARTELETCAHLDADSVEVHYRLARLYRALGLEEQARKELALRSAAEQRLAASNEARQRSLRVFLYSMKER